MRNLAEIRQILQPICYKNIAFELGEMGGGYYLQVVPPNESSAARRWYIRPSIQKHELIQTALLAIVAHENPPILSQINYQTATGTSTPASELAFEQGLSPINYSTHDLDF